MTPAPTWIALCIAILAAPHAAIADDSRWGGAIAVASDAVLHGLSQSGNRPALQGDLHVRAAGGFVGAALTAAAQGDRRDAMAMVSVYVGSAVAPAPDWTLQWLLIHYDDLARARPGRYAYDELLGSVGWRDRAVITLGAAPDRRLASRYGRVGDGLALSGDLTLHQSLPRGFAADAGLGYYDLQRVLGSGYRYWNIGLRWQRGDVELGLAWIGADARADRLIYDQPPARRGVGTLAWRF